MSLLSDDEVKKVAAEMDKGMLDAIRPTKPPEDQEKLLDFVTDPKTLAKAVEGSMEKRAAVLYPPEDLRAQLRQLFSDKGVYDGDLVEDDILRLCEAAVLAARIEGMEQAKSRVLRRTEIPKDAREPTRDAIVILGEQIADIIQQDIATAQANIHKAFGSSTNE